MSKQYYRTADIEGETRPVCYGETNWKDNEPFDGIEVTDEPFNITNYLEYIFDGKKWIHSPLPKDYNGIITACILFFMLLFPFFTQAQKAPKRDEHNYHYSPMLDFRSTQDEAIWWGQCGLMFISGGARGWKDAISFKYPTVKARLPWLNDGYCNPSQSYLRKWKNNDPLQGERYFGSSRWFVQGTDSYHASQCLMHVTFYMACTIPLWQKEDRHLKFWPLVGRYATLFGANSLAYTLVYDRYFR